MFAYVATAELGPTPPGVTPPPTGITAFRVDASNGRMEWLQHVSLANPMFLALSGSSDILYAISRASEGPDGPEDRLVAYAIDPVTGEVRELNRTPIGGYPAYVSLDQTDAFALYVSTFSGTVGAVALSRDGGLGEANDVRLPGRSLVDQGLGAESIGKVKWPYGDTPFPHSVILSPDNRFAFVADVGLNKVHVFAFDATTGVLTPNDPSSIDSVPIRHAWNREQNPVWENPTGAGPRHIEFHPNGRWLYVVHEAGSVITVLDYEAEAGRLTASQEVGTLPEGFSGSSSPADIHVHPNGRFLYATNRRHDSVVSYAIDPDSGRLTLLEFTPAGGKNPRAFVFTPGADLILLSLTGSDAVVALKVDPETGSLEANGVINLVPSPVHAVLYTR